MPRRRNKPRVPKEPNLDCPINEDIKLETMEVEGTVYFPCRVCNRLFKEHKQAMEHVQKCKPRIYLFSHDELTKQKTEQVNRDPYEIIPEEMDMDLNVKINNNNCVNRNNNTEDSQWSKDPVRNAEEDKGSSKKNLKRKNANVSPKKNTPSPPDNKRRGKKLTEDEIADRLKKISESLKNCKKKGNETQQSETNKMPVLTTGDVIQKTEPELPQRDKINQVEKNEFQMEEHPIEVENINMKKRPRRGKKINSEINEKLVKISQTLRNGKQRESKIVDDDEEDERRAIEERLSTLNKDSEVLMFENEEELEERLKEEIEGQVNNESQEQDKNVIVITQKPDGQLHGCKKCSEVFVTALELLRHMRSKHTYPRILLAPNELKKYMDHENRTHCPICEKPLPSTYRCVYLTHLKTHSGLAEFECSICKKKFTRKDHMKAHEKRHIV